MTDNKYQTAIFAGGCFWCVETPFSSVEGVISAESGYTGGKVKDPSYLEVSSGRTGHYEAVKVIYASEQIPYPGLLAVFWAQIDPTDPDGQFTDRGSQYRTAIFYLTEKQRKAAHISKEIISEKFDKPIVTEIIPASDFYRAEEYHQEYCKKNPLEYKLYKEGSGRAGFLSSIWGKNGIEELTKLLADQIPA